MHAPPVARSSKSRVLRRMSSSGTSAGTASAPGNSLLRQSDNASVGRASHHASAGAASSDAASSATAAHAPHKHAAGVVCTAPLQLLGIQGGTPIAWSTDGTRLACVSGNGSIFVLEQAMMGQDQFVVQHTLAGGHRESVLCLAFHPKLPVLASAGLDGFCVWNLADGTLSTRVLSGQGRDGHDGAVECLLYIYDGATLLTGGRDANVCAWDAQNAYLHLETITGHKGHVLCMDYSPQTDLLVSGGRELQIKIWAAGALNPSQRRRHAEDASCRVSLVQNIDAYSGDVTVLKWLREGSVLVSGARDNSVRLWDRASGKLVRVVHGAHGDIRGIFFINQERLMLVASADGNVRLYELLADMSVANDAAATDTSDAANFRTRVLGEYAIAQRLLTTSTATDRLVHTFSAHADDISNMALNSALPLLATSNTYNVVRVWNIQNLLQPAMLHELVGHRGSVTSVHLLRKDGAILSASEDYFVHVFDTHSLHRFATIPFGASANATAVDEVNELVYIGGNDYVIQAWRLNGLASVRTTPALARSSTMSGTPGSSAATGGASASRVRSSSSSAPGGAAGTPTALATITAEQVARLEGHSGRVIAMAVSPDGQVLVTSSHDFKLLTWDMRGLVDDAGSTSNRRASKTVPPNSNSGAANDDASTAPLGGQRAAQRVIRRAHETSGHSGRVTAMAFNDDGSLLATGGADRQVCLWRVHGVALSPLMQVKNAHSAVVCSVAFGRHKSAGLLASSSWDATIKLWALPMADEQTSSSVARATAASGDANTPVAVLTGHSARVTSIEVTDDGAQLVSASCDLSARVWSLAPPYAQVALYRAQVNEGSLESLAVGRSLFATGSENGLIRVWPLPGVPQYENLFVSAASAPAGIVGDGGAGASSGGTIDQAMAAGVLQLQM